MHLQQCGYEEDLLRPNFRFGGNRPIDLAAFAHQPLDARTACIAVISAANGEREQVLACREQGSPVVLSVAPESLHVWKQRETTPELREEVPSRQIAAFFRSHKRELSPDAIFRAKTWGRFEQQYQLAFVDAGLMPLVESEIGERLKSLIERVVHDLRYTLWPPKKDISDDQGHWLLKSAFWLLAAKILRDKAVPGFKTLDLLDIDNVFRRVARHYGSGQGSAAGISIPTGKQRKALGSAAEQIASFSHLGSVTTEALAHVYESALITKDTRASLGTHSTPAYLVDYLVWKLAPWIREIPVDERNVFEPACGHAAFLASSMRLLKDLLPPERLATSKQYLRTRLHGIEIDPFALEIGRLSLTLADIPNPNGWDLSCADMFMDQQIERRARQSTILLANAPFEKFTPAEKERCAQRGVTLRHTNKTAEVLARSLKLLKPGAVFGFVVPQSVLHDKNTAELREFMARNFELGEVCLFPDGVFKFSGAESALITGRRVNRPRVSHEISYRRVREADMPRFRLDYAVSSKQSIPQNAISQRNKWSMRFPDRYEVWTTLEPYPQLTSLAQMGQGLFYIGEKRRSPEQPTVSRRRFAGAVQGFSEFDTGVMLHQLPQPAWMSLNPDVIDRIVTGATTGTLQVLLNYAPVSRGPWRLKALLDSTGHAVTSRFVTVRPKSSDVPLEYLWALLNGPLANAYVYAHSMKRDILVGMMRRMPVPNASQPDMMQVAGLAKEYLREAAAIDPTQSPTGRERLKRLLMELDAAVLRLYDLAPKAERQILDLFAGQKRVGVPFHFDRYFPEDFEPWVPLHEYLSDEYRRSTAGALRDGHRNVTSQELLAAFGRARESFEE